MGENAAQPRPLTCSGTDLKPIYSTTFIALVDISNAFCYSRWVKFTHSFAVEAIPFLQPTEATNF